LRESIRRSRTNCHASGVRFVVSVKIRSIGRICIVIRLAACTIVNVSNTCDAEGITITAVSLIYWVAYPDLNIKFVLSSRTVTLANISISPLIVLICAESAVSICRAKAFHAPLITKSAEISLAPIIICGVG
jgi:hypothetical protein